VGQGCLEFQKCMVELSKVGGGEKKAGKTSDEGSMVETSQRGGASRQRVWPEEIGKVAKGVWEGAEVPSSRPLKRKGKNKG